MVARKKYQFLCCVLSIAIVLSPCTIVLNPCTKVLACPPDCSDEELAYNNAKDAYDYALIELTEAKEGLKKALDDLAAAIATEKQAEKELENAQKAYVALLVAVYNAQKAVSTAKDNLALALAAYTTGLYSLWSKLGRSVLWSRRNWRHFNKLLHTIR